MQTVVFLLFNLPSIVLCLIYGPLSDKIGRKPLLIFTTTSILLNSILVILIAQLELGVIFIYIGALVRGLCGGSFCLTMIIWRYIVDIYDDAYKTTVRLGK